MKNVLLIVFLLLTLAGSAFAMKTPQKMLLVPMTRLPWICTVNSPRPTGRWDSWYEPAFATKGFVEIITKTDL